jgi:hypothetical protein
MVLLFSQVFVLTFTTLLELWHSAGSPSASWSSPRLVAHCIKSDFWGCLQMLKGQLSKLSTERAATKPKFVSCFSALPSVCLSISEPVPGYLNELWWESHPLCPPPIPGRKASSLPSHPWHLLWLVTVSMNHWLGWISFSTKMQLSTRGQRVKSEHPWQNSNTLK